MTAQSINSSKSPHPLAWAAGIVLIIFCITGIAAIFGWIPTSMGGADNTPVTTNTGKSQPKAAQTGTAKAPASAKAPVQVAKAATPAVTCAYCGVVSSVRVLAAPGEGSGLGAAGGAVVGGLLGHQVGGGSGKQIATVVGAVGGAVAGNEVEKRVNSTKSQEVTVRLEDGSSRVITDNGPVAWVAGDHVKIIDGALRRN